MHDDRPVTALFLRWLPSGVVGQLRDGKTQGLDGGVLANLHEGDFLRHDGAEVRKDRAPLEEQPAGEGHEGYDSAGCRRALIGFLPFKCARLTAVLGDRDYAEFLFIAGRPRLKENSWRLDTLKKINHDIVKDRSVLDMDTFGYSDGNRFGDGPNWKFRTIRAALETMDIDRDILLHGIRRQVFVSLLARNACEILRGEQRRPNYADLLSVKTLSQVAIDRWIRPRAERRPDYKSWRREFIVDRLNPTAHACQALCAD